MKVSLGQSREFVGLQSPTRPSGDLERPQELFLPGTPQSEGSLPEHALNNFWRAAAAYGSYTALVQAANISSPMAPPPGLDVESENPQFAAAVAAQAAFAAGFKSATVAQALAAQAAATLPVVSGLGAQRGGRARDAQPISPSSRFPAKMAKARGREADKPRQNQCHQQQLRQPLPPGAVGTAAAATWTTAGQVRDYIVSPPRSSTTASSEATSPSGSSHSPRLRETRETVAMACDAQGRNVITQRLSEEPRATAELFRGSVLRLATDRHGCRLLQHALVEAPLDLKVQLALELRGHVVECIEHMHGNFVIQRCIEQLPVSGLDFLVQEIGCHAEYLSVHMYGCRAVQRLFEYATEEQLGDTLEQILACVGKLAVDTYGNNVLRHILQYGSVEAKKRIINSLLSTASLLDLGSHRSASLVLERCLDSASVGDMAKELEEERAALVRAALETTPRGTSALQELTMDKFGNYLVQRILQCSRGEEREIVRLQLRAKEHELRCHSGGKHILAAMRREFGHGGSCAHKRGSGLSARKEVKA